MHFSKFISAQNRMATAIMENQTKKRCVMEARIICVLYGDFPKFVIIRVSREGDYNTGPAIITPFWRTVIRTESHAGVIGVIWGEGF